jgi:hypothetical protein
MNAITQSEKSKLKTPEIEFHQAEYERLVAQLETEAVGSTLPVGQQPWPWRCWMMACIASSICSFRITASFNRANLGL